MNKIYSDQERKEDFKYFLSNYNDIYKKYGHCFVAVKNKEIIGVFHDEESAIESTSSLYKLGEFIVQECNGNESGYTNYVMTVGMVLL